MFGMRQGYSGSDQTLLNELVEPKGGEVFEQGLQDAFLSVGNEGIEGDYDPNATFDSSFEQVYDNDFNPDVFNSDEIGFDDMNSDDDGASFDDEE